MRRFLHSAAATLMLAATAPVLAQTTAPSSPAPAPAPSAGVADYWWLILVVIVAGVAGWYFMRGRGRA